MVPGDTDIEREGDTGEEQEGSGTHEAMREAMRKEDTAMCNSGDDGSGSRMVTGNGTVLLSGEGPWMVPGDTDIAEEKVAQKVAQKVQGGNVPMDGEKPAVSRQQQQQELVEQLVQNRLARVRYEDGLGKVEGKQDGKHQQQHRHRHQHQQWQDDDEEKALQRPTETREGAKAKAGVVAEAKGRITTTARIAARSSLQGPPTPDMAETAHDTGGSWDVDKSTKDQRWLNEAAAAAAAVEAAAEVAAAAAEPHSFRIDGRGGKSAGSFNGRSGVYSDSMHLSVDGGLKIGVAAAFSAAANTAKRADIALAGDVCVTDSLVHAMI
jgi:hypothetical protein